MGKLMTGQRNKKKERGQGLLSLGILVLLVLLWQVLVSVGKVPPYILPAPSQVFQALYQERNLLFTHTLVTLGEALSGFGIAVFLGALLGLLMGFYEPLRKALYPLFVLTQAIPLIILAPLFAIWFGFGFLPKLLIVVLVCFFPVAVTFTQGLVRADEDLDQLLKVMGASKWKAFLVARVPRALPGLFSGIKLAATYSVMGAVLSEWVGAQKGLGIFMTRAMTSFKTPVLFADVLVIVALSLGIYKLVEIVERRITKYIQNTDL